jgi:type II secretory ATPase GspE/PulE/Tfp pilus assembly ATPase PilB-like protein
MNEALRAAILAGADAQALAQSNCCAGSLRDDAQRHLYNGVTTLDEVQRVVGA